MIKAFAVGAMAAVVIFGSTLGASAQTNLSPAQAAVIAACSATALAADSGAQCAIALRALAPGEYAAIRAVVEAGAGTQVAFLDDAIASSGIETGAIDNAPTVPVITGPTTSNSGSQGSPA